MVYILRLPNGKQIEVETSDYSSDKLKQDDLHKDGYLDGWRLPQIHELEYIFSELHKKNLGDFKDDWYYSGSVFEVSWEYSLNLALDFKSGEKNARYLGVASKTRNIGEFYLRRVRDK